MFSAPGCCEIYLRSTSEFGFKLFIAKLLIISYLEQINLNMARKQSSDPTPAELEILQVLWESGPQSVRQVWESLGSKGSYTTTLKFLQIMFEKGLVERDDSKMTHVFRAAVAEDVSQREIVGGIIDRVFGGSVSRLVLRALSAKKTSPAELETIRKLLDQAQKENKRRKL